MNFLLSEILKPLLHRLGSYLAVSMASFDYFSSGELQTLETALVLLSGFATDIVIRRLL